MDGKQYFPQAFLYFLAVLCPASAALSQTQLRSDIELHFGGIGTDGVNSVVPLSDGGFALGGWKSIDGEIDLTEGWILRVDARGAYIWDIPLPQSGPYGVVALSADFDGGVIAVDSVHGKSTGTTRLSKLSPDGSVDWQKVYGRSNGDVISSIRPTFDGGLILAGKTSFKTSGASDGWIVKLDRNHEIEWFRVLGGLKEDAFEDIALSTEGGYVAVGWTTLADDTVLGWVTKVDTAGATEWTHEHSLGLSTEFHKVLPAADGSFVYAATKKTHNNDPGRGTVVGALTIDGAMIWQHDIIADGTVMATGLAHSAASSYLLSASVEDKGGQAGLVAGFTSTGNIDFLHRYNSKNDRKALAISAGSSGYAVAGTSLRNLSLDQDAWLLIRPEITTRNLNPQASEQ